MEYNVHMWMETTAQELHLIGLQRMRDISTPTELEGRHFGA